MNFSYWESIPACAGGSFACVLDAALVRHRLNEGRSLLAQGISVLRK
jgi:hypothetical protein